MRASALRAAFAAVALAKNYRAGVDDDESVVIKKRAKTKNFELTMLSAPIAGLGVKLKH